MHLRAQASLPFIPDLAAHDSSITYPVKSAAMAHAASRSRNAIPLFTGGLLDSFYSPSNGDSLHGVAQLRGQAGYVGFGITVLVLEPHVALVSGLADHAQQAVPIGLFLGSIRGGDLCLHV